MEEYTNYPEGLSSMGIPMLGAGNIPVTKGKYWFVDGYYGNNGAGGHEMKFALKTISEAVARATTTDVIVITPGSYDESVVISRSVGALTLVGLGNKGDVGIAPSTLGAKGLVFHNDDLTLINVGVAGESTATSALSGTGSRLRTFNCKLEGVDTSGACLSIGPGSVAQVAAGTAGHSGDIKLYNTEFAWAFDGIAFVASDYGTPTQVEIVNPLFHNISNTEMIGVPGAFGIGSVRNLECYGGTFDNMEDATAPSDYININTAFDTGIFHDNSFALATNAIADIKIGAGIMWVANKTEAGSSTARPA